MPRYGIKPAVVAEWCRIAGVDQSVYTVELSYQTNTNLFWAKMSKGAVTLPEYSTVPDLNTIDQVVIGILREGKRQLETRQASDYLDTSIVLPDKPAQTISGPRP